MSERIWSAEDLVRFVQSEDAEVRFWAVERLVRHYPEECCDRIADLVLDDHEATPGVVARHLGEHGGPQHHAVLVRGFRLLRGTTPAHCLRALVRLAYPNAVGLASDALRRGDLNEPVLGMIVEALAELDTPDAREQIREFLKRRPELWAEPAALGGILRTTTGDGLPEVLDELLRVLEWRGAHRAGEAFRTLMSALRVDDAAWCFRTGPSGHLELRKTIKAVESGYDCDILQAMGEPTIRSIAQRLRAGHYAEVVRSIGEWTVAAAARLPVEPGCDLPARTAAAARALASDTALGVAERTGHQFQQWLLGFQLSAAFAMARGLNLELDLQRARGHLDRLLKLAEIETAHLLDDLPTAIAAECRDDPARVRRAQDWCLRMLEAQGPFFPKVVALDLLGELGAVPFLPEILGYLSDENSYIYGAAERALSRMGEAVLAPAVERIESGDLDPEAAHSLLVLLCDLGTQAALDAVTRNIDWFMDAVGAGQTAEWVGVLGVEELIDPLRDRLDDDPPMVGQALLLLGAIHNVKIPEEGEILEAIEDERARQAGDGRDEEGPTGPEQGGGSYVM
jgi:predicted outer membrane lipoprotein